MNLADIVRDVSVGFGAGILMGISGIGSKGEQLAEEIELTRDNEKARAGAKKLREMDTNAKNIPIAIGLIGYSPARVLSGAPIHEALISGGLAAITGRFGMHTGKKLRDYFGIGKGRIKKIKELKERPERLIELYKPHERQRILNLWEQIEKLYQDNLPDEIKNKSEELEDVLSLVDPRYGWAIEHYANEIANEISSVEIESRRLSSIIELALMEGPANIMIPLIPCDPTGELRVYALERDELRIYRANFSKGIRVIVNESNLMGGVQVEISEMSLQKEYGPKENEDYLSLSRRMVKSRRAGGAVMYSSPIKVDDEKRIRMAKALFSQAITSTETYKNMARKIASNFNGEENP